ncbi:hypothetical protein [Methylomonas koyamae]|uniref:Uncharacterized protein n=1 Tax=Methylomonas koyamae TaxID=702114 RepID=A0A291IG49_9GAMM|nr:hypothetical protein [Methylomonas koyamae]ATG89140.1 hypothetical protein MKLM6_0871 [Methylomonas koyamae]OAI24129.1 hypothetical protein A1356_16665 [Methylomonas koyamae]
MDWTQILDTLNAMTPAERRQWELATTGVAAATVCLLWLESRFFRRSGRVASWLAVRIASLIAAPLTFAVLVMPAQAVSGMEGLAVFYLSLFTAAPLLWFGCHIICGRLASPGFSRNESIALGFSGLAILAVPLTGFFAAQNPLHDAARQIGLRRELPADNPPLPYRAETVTPYTMPGAGLIYTQSLQAEPGIRLQRVEQRLGGYWPAYDIEHPDYCTHGNDVHLMWAAQELPPYLRLSWLQSDGRTATAEFTPNMASADKSTAQIFSANFRDNGLDPVAPIPRVRMHLILLKEGLPDYTEILGNPPEAGEHRRVAIFAERFFRASC